MGYHNIIWWKGATDTYTYLLKPICIFYAYEFQLACKMVKKIKMLYPKFTNRKILNIKSR